MKNPKAIYKYTHDNEIGYMHYVVYQGSVVVLSKTDSLKIDFINKNGYLEITGDIRHNDFTRVECKVETDPKYIQEVYDYMLETDNSYFKDGIEGLCAIIFVK